MPTKAIKPTLVLPIFFSSCLGVTVAAADTDQAADENSTTENQATSNLEAIVVSGEKQDRSLKDTISSVSVIGEDKLRTTQFVTVRDAIQGAPNVIVPAGQVPTVRGVDGNGGAGGFFGVAGGANARVSMLVDGVPDPYIAIFAGDSGLWDVEQIEVYRGPQSTNNGRNSIAGAIYLKTKKPTFDWEGKVRAGYRNEDSNLDTAVVVSGPIIDDTLAVRFSGQMLDQDTIINNEEFASNPANYDLDKYESDNGRLKLLWTPSDQVEAMLTYSTLEEKGVQSRRFYTNTTDFILAYPSNQFVENDTLSLNLGYTFNASTSVDILIANQSYTMGYDSYEALPEDVQQFRTEQDSSNLDIKLNFGEGNVNLFGHVGVAYFEREQDIASTGIVVPTTAAVYEGDDTSDSQAVYGELNYALTSKLLLTGGMRYQEEQQIRDFQFRSILIDLDLEEEIFLPSLAFQYDVTEDTRLGFSARQGYNSAGGSAHPRFGTYFFYDEEEVNAFELSARSGFADNTVLIRTNIFFNEYDGYQATDSSSPQAIVNVDAETFGAEFEATAQVSPGIEVNLGFGLLQSEITDGRSVSGITGNKLTLAPEKTASVGATYFVTDAFDIGARLKYTGGYFTTLSNTESTKTAGFSTLDLTTSYEHGAWLISGFVNNATDKTAVRNFAFGTYDVIEPRSIGAAVTYSFF